MEACEQTAGQSILAHGESVARYYRDIHAWLTTGQITLPWRIPTWLNTPEAKQAIKERLLPFDVAQTYQVYHDCGKPFCLTIDNEGRRHFPNHAQISAETWRRYGGSEQEARLMLMDMDIHTLKAEGIEEFAGRREAATLLLTGLAEIHSNAEMFGGIDSTGFKIKWKQIDRRGRAIMSRWLT